MSKVCCKHQNYKNISIKILKHRFRNYSLGEKEKKNKQGKLSDKKEENNKQQKNPLNIWQNCMKKIALQLNTRQEASTAKCNF